MTCVSAKKWLGAFLIVCLVAVCLSPGEGHAATGYTATGIDGGFFCVGRDAGGTGTLFVNRNYSINAQGVCISDSGFFGIFNTLICKYETSLYQVMSNVFCSLRDLAIVPVKMVLTLFLIIFAISFLFGIVDFTAKEVMLTIFKIVLVGSFTYEAQFVIGVAYAFFVQGTQDGVLLALGTVTHSTGVNTKAAAGVTNLNVLTEGSLLDWFMKLNPMFLSFLVLLMVIFFPVGIFIGMLILQFLMLIARAVFGYLLAITMLTFLLTLMPIFLCFALFKTTKYFFEQWIQHLMSFQLQMIVLFIVISMMNVIDFGTYFTYLSGLVHMYSIKIGLNIFNFELPFPSICRYAYPAIGGPLEAVFPGGYNTALDPRADTFRPKCIYDLALIPPLPGPGIPAGVPFVTLAPGETLNDNKMIPVFELFQQSELMGNIVLNIITLLVLCQLLETFLALVPEVSRQLAGKMFAGRLGGMGAASIKVDAGSISMTGAGALALARKGLVDGTMTASGFGHNKMYGGLLGAVATLKSLRQTGTRARAQSRGIYMDIMMEARNLGQSAQDIRDRYNPYKDAFGMAYMASDTQDMYDVDEFGRPKARTSANLFNEKSHYTQQHYIEKDIKRRKETAHANRQWYFYLSSSPDGKWNGRI